MFFSPETTTDFRDLSKEKELLSSLQQDPVITYPKYQWVRSHQTDGTILSKPEKFPTNDFNDFLYALDCLRYSSEMRSLFKPVQTVVEASLSRSLNQVERSFASLQVMLAKKKVEILKSKPVDKDTLIQNINELLTSSTQAKDNHKQNTEAKLSALRDPQRHDLSITSNSASPS